MIGFLVKVTVQESLRLLRSGLFYAQNKRYELYQEFRDGDLKALIISRVGDEGIDLPDAEVAILVSTMGSSRSQTGQRASRTMQPSDSSQSTSCSRKAAARPTGDASPPGSSRRRASTSRKRSGLGVRDRRTASLYTLYYPELVIHWFINVAPVAHFRQIAFDRIFVEAIC